MKKQLTQLAFIAGLAALVAGPATASLVAGWDFSDLSGDSASVPTNQPANLVGSATATALNVSGDVVASGMRPGSAEGDQSGLQGGINGFPATADPTFPAGTTGFDRRGELLGLTARSSANLEFDVSLAAPTSDFWVLTFGADALAAPDTNQNTTVDVAFGGSCGGAASVDSVVVTPGDTEVTVFLGQLGSAGGCVVLSVDGSATQPLIDNVAISTVPEPGPGAMLLAGAAGIVAMARRRGR